MTQTDKSNEKRKTVIIRPSDFENGFLKQMSADYEGVLKDKLKPILEHLNSVFNTPSFKHFIQQRIEMENRFREFAEKMNSFEQKSISLQRIPSPQEITVQWLERLEEKILNKQELQKTQEARQHVVCLNRHGKIYREINKQWFFEFEKGQMPEKIVRFFSNNPGPHSSKFLANELKAKDDKAIRDTIYDLNHKLPAVLHLEGKLFKGNKNGYRVNEAYTLIPTDN